MPHMPAAVDVSARSDGDAPAPRADDADAARGGYRAARRAGDPNAPRALVAQLATAIRHLSVLPLGGPRAPLGESALFFPLVGLGLGAVLVGVDHALDGLAPTPRNAAVIAVLVAATGARPLRELARGTGTLVSGHGAVRAAAVALVTVAKVAALAAVAPALRATALLLAPMLARWSIVVFAFGSRARPGGSRSPLLGAITFREFGLASVSALAIALIVADARALAAILVIAGFTIVVRLVAHRSLRGVDGDLAGAVGEVSEALALVVCTLGAGARAVVP